MSKFKDVSIVPVLFVVILFSYDILSAFEGTYFWLVALIILVGYRLSESSGVISTTLQPSVIRLYGTFLLFVVLQFTGRAIYEPNYLYFYLAFPFLMVLTLSIFRYQDVVTGLRVVVIVLMPILIFEYITEQYIYTAFTASSDVLLDEKLLSGASGFVRVKGLFDGPITLGIFIICSAIVFREESKMLIILLTAAALAGAGLAFFFTISSLLVSMCKSGPKTMVSVGLPLLICSFLLVLSGELEFQLQRIISAADIESSATNTFRIYFWASSLHHFVNYDVTEILFGSPGTFREIYNNNTESGVLAVLVDFGMLNLFLYLMGIINPLRHNFSLSQLSFISLFLLGNFLVPVTYSVIGSAGYGMAVYSLYIGSRRQL